MAKHVDPVCGMEVDESTPYKDIYKGKVYYFCSEACLVEFRKRPDYYLKHGPQGMPGHHGGHEHSHEHHGHHGHHHGHGGCH